MNKPKKIAIIGASYLQLPLVEKANSLGHETYCFAYLEGAICKDYCTKFFPVSIIEKEEITEICRSLNIDAVLSIASDLAVATVNYVAHKMGLVGNDLESTMITTNKYEMKRVLQEKNISTAKFEILRTETDLKKLSKFQYPIIVKPVDRSGSMGVSKVTSDTQLLEAFRKAIEASLSNEVIVEEFILGQELSVESISQDGSHQILAITDKVTTGSPCFVELEHHQPADINSRLRMEIEKIIPNALDILKISNGAAHSELFITSSGEIYINEIGARMGGDFIGSHLVQLSTGFNYLEAVIQIALGNAISQELLITNFSGVIYRNDSNKDRFDLILKSDDFIIELESNLKEKSPLTKSSDRGNYLVYKANKKLKI